MMMCRATRARPPVLWDEINTILKFTTYLPPVINTLFQGQTFSLTAEGKLIYDQTEKCATINKDKPYALS